MTDNLINNAKSEYTTQEEYENDLATKSDVDHNHDNWFYKTSEIREKYGI